MSLDVPSPAVATGKPKAIVLAGGFDQIGLIEELKRRNWKVVLVDYNPAPPAAPHADIHYQASTLDADAVTRIVQAEQASLLTTACTDQALLTVAQVSEALQLPCPFNTQATRQLTNKRWMKERMREAGIPTSAFTIQHEKADTPPSGLIFPLVCKPVDSNSSKGVTLAETPEQFPQAYACARAASRSGEVICEEYIDGAELSIDAFVINGTTHVLMVSESQKLANEQGAFPIHRSIQPAPAAHLLADRIKMVVSQIARAFDIDNSPMIVQAIASSRGLYILELSARIAGGAKHCFIKAATGYDVMRAYVDTLFGQHPSIPPTVFPMPADAPLHAMQYLYARPCMLAKLEGFDMLKAQGVILDYFPTKTPGMEVGSALNSSNRVAAALLSGVSTAALDEKLHQLFASARALDHNGNDMLLRQALQQ
ncbi:ATP-grasp domain-containing protein [Azoarcus indigens]|uniref:Carbamoylphosphate synthase large subunit n=1 Tax=Azoarcus indigens TaxID=29545 RepID=A0A4R6DUL0_9RHOO|nr:ATP-grasp domain-containing protein [Azoarcus indigens]NMG64456.1 ATP-grasp domain-containing protein [Azoarcus indigens]TDN48394.1 carbamoylphosphate synthase large subunit [Azoarcus indigens]